jgi:hypothetical protein
VSEKQLIKYEKYFANYVSDKALISGIHEELLQFNRINGYNSHLVISKRNKYSK